jgi:uncharacterized repeat protein (TIGR04042 family)
MRFHIRWPDGADEICYSPSLVIKDYFVPGEAYPLPDFVARSRTALTIASERVREKYGMSCSRALGQLSRIETAAQRFGATSGERVTIIAFEE